MTIQKKDIEQYFHVALFIMLYKVVLTFKSVDETLVCDNFNKIVKQYYHVALYMFKELAVYCKTDLNSTSMNKSILI